MTELIYLLFNGPTIKSNEVPERSRTHEKKYSQKMIDVYRGFSKENRIWSALVVDHRPVTIKTAARQLREMNNDNLLKEVGRVQGTRSSSPPYIYEWI